MLLRYCHQAANCINRQSEFAFMMTNGCVGTKQVKSTLPIRNAIVKYLMQIHGIVDKYYNYENTNKFLNRDFKGCTKKMMTDPHNISLEELSQSQLSSDEERCHVAIIVMETKTRVELIYFTQRLS